MIPDGSSNHCSHDIGLGLGLTVYLFIKLYDLFSPEIKSEISGLSNNLSTSRLRIWHLYLLDVPIPSFVYSFSHSVITDYIHCHVLNTDLSPKLELLPNTIHFLFVTREGTLHLVQAQTEEKVILNLSPVIRLMRHQSNPTSEPSRVY